MHIEENQYTKNVRKIFTNNLVKHASAIVNLASDRKKASSYITKQDAINDLEEQTPKAVGLHFPYTANYKVEQ
jgi:hypothetical protein